MRQSGLQAGLIRRRVAGEVGGLEFAGAEKSCVGRAERIFGPHGILSLREKVNEHFVAANHKDVKKDQVDLLEGSGRAIHGDTDHYRALITLLEGSNVSDPAVHAGVEAMVDLENFIYRGL